jgi:hypothetical protein
MSSTIIHQEPSSFHLILARSLGRNILATADLPSSSASNFYTSTHEALSVSFDSFQNIAQLLVSADGKPLTRGRCTFSFNA